MGSAEYQRLLKMLADEYSVTPDKRNMPHLEIAAIFLAHSVNYFLSEAGGTIAFVLPRSFMTADQHHNTRVGSVRGLRVTGIWDLKDVKPLFRVPSCVLFATPDQKASRSLPVGGVKGLSVVAKLPSHNLDLASASPLIEDQVHKWYYSTLAGGNAKRVRSAYTRTSVQGQSGSNAYSRFKQGATMVPRNFYFVDVDQSVPAGARLADRTIAVKTAESSNAEAKKNWKNKLISGRVEGVMLFRTAISRNVLPFCLIDPPLVTLPVVVQTKGGVGRFAMASPDDLFSAGYTNASGWFDQATKLFEKFKGEAYRKTKMTLLSRLDYQHGLTAQRIDARYLVLYTSSATDASAVVIDRRDFDVPFLADHKTYWVEVQSLSEGHYVAAFLNSEYANEAIKDFQSQGLFGERDIHKLIVMLPLPAFNKKLEAHLRVAELGGECAKLAQKMAVSEGWKSMEARALGRARSALRKRLGLQVREINKLLAAINQSKGPVGKAKKNRSQTSAGPLFDG